MCVCVVTGMKEEQCFVSSVPVWHAHKHIHSTRERLCDK